MGCGGVFMAQQDVQETVSSGGIGTFHCYRSVSHSYDPIIFEENIYCFDSNMKNCCNYGTILSFTLEY